MTTAGVAGGAYAINTLTRPLASRVADWEIYSDATRGAATGPVKFGQIGVSPEFSKAGAFEGRLIDKVADALRSGDISPNDIQISTIRWNGEVVAVNNRSLTALSKAGYQPPNVIDVTKDLSFSLADPDNVYAMVQRMREIGFKPSTSIGVRPPNSHWTTPPSYFVEIPKK